MTQEKTLILIPSSQFVPRELELEVGRIPPVLIPVHGRTLLSLIVEQFGAQSNNIDILIAAHDGKELIDIAVSRLKTSTSITVVEVPRLDALGDVVLAALRSIDLNDYRNLVVNFGDTLLEVDFPFGEDLVFYSNLPESFRWTTFEQVGGRLSRILEKNQILPHEWHHVFTGVFAFSKPSLFLESLESAALHPMKQCLDPFYAGLEHYLELVDYALKPVHEWHDFGHIDNYYTARKRFVNSRYFNQISIDPHRAVLTKSSTNSLKLMSETRWYLELPDSLRCYTPQVFSHAFSESKASLSLEYYGYPTVAELFLYGAHDLSVWHYALDAIFRVMAEMQAITADEEPICEREALSTIYIDKTLSRLHLLEDQPLFSAFFEHNFSINNKSYPSLRVQMQALLPAVLERLIETQRPLSIIHGDFCISNILFDPKSRIIKLIDPRGSFGDYVTFGDARYDMAKLAHSLLGHYELIVNDQGFCIVDELAIQYELVASTHQNAISELFKNRLNALPAAEQKQIALIEALLFLSMVPLHADKPHRQLLMLCKGVEKLAPFIEIGQQTSSGLRQEN